MDSNVIRTPTSQGIPTNNPAATPPHQHNINNARHSFIGSPALAVAAVAAPTVIYHSPDLLARPVSSTTRLMGRAMGYWQCSYQIAALVA